MHEAQHGEESRADESRAEEARRVAVASDAASMSVHNVSGAHTAAGPIANEKCLLTTSRTLPGQCTVHRAPNGAVPRKAHVKFKEALRGTWP